MNKNKKILKVFPTAFNFKTYPKHCNIRLKIGFVYVFLKNHKWLEKFFSTIVKSNAICYS